MVPGPAFVFIAASRDALAFTNNWIEELVSQAGSFNAVTAAAAVRIPSLRFIARKSSILIAFATAVISDPIVVIWAYSVKTSASALFSVPVVSISEAFLRGALPFATF